MGLNIKLVAFISGLLFISCGEKYQPTNLINVRKEYYPNTRLKKEYQVIYDTIKHGYYHQYHENGYLATEGFYANDIKEGYMKEFYENGRVAAEGLYKNGQREGLWKWYYKTGFDEGRENYKSGQLIGESYDWYENGKMKKYGFYDIETHELVYVRMYDSLGVVTKTSGNILSRIDFVSTVKKDSIINNTPIKAGSPFTMVIYIATPPETRSNLDVEIKNLNGKQVSPMQKDLPIINNKTTSTFIISEPGTYRAYVHYYVKYFDTGQTIGYDPVFDITVE